MTSPSVRLGELTVAYRRRPALSSLSGEFAGGSLTAVVGPNGGGKSTLLKTIVGILRPTAGSVTVSDIGRRDIGYLPQLSELDRSFPISVADLVALGAWRRTGPLRRIGAGEETRIAEAIAAVGLGGLENERVGTLSGGQLQRALFARLLVQDARLLVLDEPFTAIDSRTTDELILLVRRWHGEGRTIIVALHDLDLVRDHFPAALLLAREAVAWGPAAEVLSHGNLASARRRSDGFDVPAMARRAA